MQEALDHIDEYGSHHSDAILTENYTNAMRFFDEVDSACVYVNASTQFTDGAQFGLGAEVELLGARAPNEIDGQLEWADVFVHGAVSEGFCNAVIEAQSMELPVVCTDADGLRENVADGTTGFVVPRRDPEALAAKLEVLARDPALRQRMGKAGRKRVLENFQLSDQLDRLEDFYRQVLNGVRADSGREEGAEPPPRAARSAVRT